MSTKTTPELPGLTLAKRCLQPTERDIDDIFADVLNGCDPEDPDTGNPGKPSPDQALNALLILRLMHAHASIGQPAMLPPRGGLTLIAAERSEDRKRLAASIKELNIELLTANADIRHRLNDLEIHTHPKLGASPLELRRVAEGVEDGVMRGRAVIYIVDRMSGLPDGMASAATAQLTLPSATVEMLSAILREIHKGKRRTKLPAGVDIGAMSELRLARVFAADSMAAAMDALHEFGLPDKTKPGITLDKVHGQPGAKAAFQQLLDDLNDWRKGSLDWSEVTSSFIFHGPPGTGKTMLSEALAGSAGVSFIRTSYSDCQRHGHQGDMLRVLTETVEKAITNAPAILFIDEIDSFYSRTGDTRFSGYMTGVVNGLLTLLDRLNSTPGVIVIGATNHLSMIDPAIIRPGRFDCHIPVDPLDRSGVMAMIAAQIPDILNDDEAQMLADQLIGQTGATVAAMLRDARTKSRRDRIPMTARHIFDAAEAVAPVPDPELLRRVALHEAGHLLMGHLSGFSTPKRAAIRGRSGEILREMPDVLTPTLANGMLKIYLAGRVTEAMFFQEISSGAGGTGRASDLALATAMALQIELNFGFADRLTWHDPTIPPNLHSHEIRIAVEKRLQASDSAVRAALAPHVRDLERIAQALMDERELDRDRLSELLAAVPIPGNADKTDHPLSSAG